MNELGIMRASAMSECEITLWAPSFYILLGATVTMLGTWLGWYQEFMRPKNKKPKRTLNGKN
jgi:hypothetical protein